MPSAPLRALPDLPPTSIYFWFGYPLPPRERMQAIARAGFDAVSLWWGESRAGGAGKQHLPALARQAGLGVDHVHAPYAHANDLWRAGVAGETLVAVYARCLDDCRRHGIPVMVLHASQGENPPPVTTIGLARLRRLVAHAEQQQVTIALENLRQSAHLEQAFATIHSHRLRFCYDSGHENHYTGKWDLLDRYGDRLAALHLHDNSGHLDQHLPPGAGTVPWDWLMRRIAQTGYRGAVSLEVSNVAAAHWRAMSAEAFLHAAYRAAHRLRQLMMDADTIRHPDPADGPRL